MVEITQNTALYKSQKKKININLKTQKIFLHLKVRTIKKFKQNNVNEKYIN